jgi:hypothetical protein
MLQAERKESDDETRGVFSNGHGPEGVNGYVEASPAPAMTALPKCAIIGKTCHSGT